MKIVLVADIHYPHQPLGDILLLRLVHRINRYIKPDAVLVAGDLIHATADPECLRELAAHLRLIEAPLIVIPGNHDPAPDVFYRYLPRPAEFIDINEWRIIPFADTETPNHNARRSPYAIDRMRRLTDTGSKYVISLQHYPLFPPGINECPYNYENADAILDVPIAVTLAGHYHPGTNSLSPQPNRHGRGTFCYVTPALCRSPFCYSVLNLREAPNSSMPAVDLQVESLRPPVESLCDSHVHTRFAYCSEANWDAERLFALAEAFGVKKFAFTEHTGHLYTDYARFRAGEIDRQGLAGATQNRFAEYKAFLDSLQEHHDNFLRGLEVDIDAQGRPLLRPEDGEGLPFRIGAVHRLTNTEDLESAKKEFLFRCEALCQSGIKVLAHPFRVFHKKMHIAPPPDLFRPLADMLKKYRVAAEINFHGNRPEPEFFAMCHALRVPLTLGSDTHNLYEIGEFYAGLRLLEQIGCEPEELMRLM